MSQLKGWLSRSSYRFVARFIIFILFIYLFILSFYYIYIYEAQKAETVLSAVRYSSLAYKAFAFMSKLSTLLG